MRKKQAAAVIMLVMTGFTVGRYVAARGHNPGTIARRILYYVDPMHPAYRSDKPGTAPDCGMVLEPVFEDEDPAAKLQLAHRDQLRKTATGRGKGGSCPEKFWNKGDPHNRTSGSRRKPGASSDGRYGGLGGIG